jgi:hypothetical protein
MTQETNEVIQQLFKKLEEVDKKQKELQPAVHQYFDNHEAYNDIVEKAVEAAQEAGLEELVLPNGDEIDVRYYDRWDRPMSGSYWLPSSYRC